MCEGYLLVDIYISAVLNPDLLGIKRYDSYNDALAEAKKLIRGPLRGKEISEEDEELMELSFRELRDNGHTQIGDLYLEIRDMA